MRFKDTDSEYGLITQLLHWLVGGLMIGQVILVAIKRYAFVDKDPRADFYIQALHKPIGLSLMGLSLLFLVWRLINSKPKPVSFQPLYERIAAVVTHTGLYGVCLLMPLSGILMTADKGRAIPFFGGFELVLPWLKGQAPWGWRLHQLSGTVFLALLALHGVGVLVHQFVYRDRTLARMSLK